AASAQAEQAERGGRIVGEPKRQVGRVREHIEQTELSLRATNLHDAVTAAGQVVQVVLREHEGDGVRGASGGARHKYRAKLRFKTALHMFAAAQQRARNGGGAFGQDLLVRNQ